MPPRSVEDVLQSLVRPADRDTVSGDLLIGAAAAIVSTFIVEVGQTMMYTLWNDEKTGWAIAHSGGLEEAYTLPVFMIGAATMLAIAGACLGKILHLLGRRSSSGELKTSA